jgi:hypothetical protein
MLARRVIVAAMVARKEALERVGGNAGVAELAPSEKESPGGGRDSSPGSY